MRYLYTICLLLILSSFHLSAQDTVSCTHLNQMTSLAASIGIQSSGDGICAETVDLSNFQVEAGTPDAICEQATPAISPSVVEWDEAEEVLEDGVDYQAIFCTDVGAIHLELFEEETPLAVNNLVFLAQNNYYNNTIFHRVIEDFMAQGGDPTSTGRGNPGYDFDNEIVQDLSFDRPYLLAMANAGPDTNGSQFFITFVETPHLDGGYTIFGEVISGQDAVDDILLRDPAELDADGTVLYAVVIVSPEQVLQQ